MTPGNWIGIGLGAGLLIISIIYALAGLFMDASPIDDIKWWWERRFDRKLDRKEKRLRRKQHKAELKARYEAKLKELESEYTERQH